MDTLSAEACPGEFDEEHGDCVIRIYPVGLNHILLWLIRAEVAGIFQYPETDSLSFWPYYNSL
jgi:hypothetical protein